jgi:transcriptional regulator with XRE-family HTH domain
VSASQPPASPDVVYTRHFGTKLRELRELRGLTQGELGGQVGVTRQYISDLECGRLTNPTLQVLLGIMDSLDLNSIEQLLSGLSEWGSQIVLREEQP